MTTCQTDLHRIIEAYGQRWNGHDLDGIMAMHTPDTMFRLHLLGMPEITGSDAVRAAFAGLLATWPDMQSTTDQLTVGDGHYVYQYTISASLAVPLPLGAIVVQPTGKVVQFGAIDVFTMAGDLVQRKETYLDIAEALQQLGVL
ncbi:MULTISPECIES: nuclear transport factor 2 family protein [unclassified Mycobacterium]|uniref:nuclear transport factor 2 family protein n=1 Tax=unclassified Mycobacterium TaxID=2642494 RepID=UPI0029C90D34|nr:MULTISPECIES: nuclear transport factor 2 family protein [unclassified Mycobacterium]